MVGEHFYAHLIAMFLNGSIILLLWSEFILETAPLAQLVECNMNEKQVASPNRGNFGWNPTKHYLFQSVFNTYLCIT